MSETRCRVPDILVMVRPYRRSDLAIVDPPFLIVEVLSPDDRVAATMNRYRDYEAFGVQHIIQMEPEERTTPFHSKEILARLDDELA